MESNSWHINLYLFCKNKTKQNLTKQTKPTKNPNNPLDSKLQSIKHSVLSQLSHSLKKKFQFMLWSHIKFSSAKIWLHSLNITNKRVSISSSKNVFSPSFVASLYYTLLKQFSEYRINEFLPLLSKSTHHFN